MLVVNHSLKFFLYLANPDAKFYLAINRTVNIQLLEEAHGGGGGRKKERIGGGINGGEEN